MKWVTTVILILSLVSAAKAPERDIEFEKEVKQKAIKEYKGKELERFLEDMKQRESSGNWKVINEKSGAMGFWQFMPNTLKDYHIYLQPNQFEAIPYRFSPMMQEQVMRWNLKKNEKRLKEYINKYENKTFRGVLVTKSGILAAAHLAGAKGVKMWFKYGYNPDDGKTYLTDYLIKFSNYGF